MWYTVSIDGDKMYVRTNSSRAVYQNSGKLFLGNFQSIQTVKFFCDDEVLSVYTELKEGVLIARRCNCTSYMYIKSSQC